MVNHFAIEERTVPICQYMFLYEARISVRKIHNLTDTMNYVQFVISVIYFRLV